METTTLPGSTHYTALHAGVVETAESASPASTILYGTSDPVPNVAELVLTAIAASVFRLPALFSVYEGGRTEYADLSRERSRELVVGSDVPSIADSIRIVSGWLGLEIPLIPFERIFALGGVWDVPLADMAKAMLAVQHKPLRFCYVPADPEPQVVYTDGRWVKRNGTLTVAELHNRGGWLGGAGIHYALRQFAEGHPDHIHLVPFGMKGEVYRTYRRTDGQKTRFALVPQLHIQPRNASPEWLPLELQTFATILELLPEGRAIELREGLVSAVNAGTSIKKVVATFGVGGSFTLTKI
ncbi:MAG: hypothetical protein AAB463_00055 [Patescibacteria group bacterium]